MSDYISLSPYESDSDYERDFEFNYKDLLAIFQLDDVKLLKRALITLTPQDIYKSVGLHCFCSIEQSDEGNREEDNDICEPYVSIRCFKYLVKRGLDINSKSKNGRIPLYYACRYNRNAILYLLRNGADPNYFDDNDDNLIATYLIRSSQINKFDINILKEAINQGLRLDYYFLTSNVIHSIFNTDIDYREVFGLLIEHGFNINMKDHDGDTIIYGFRIHDKDKIREIISFLYYSGFDFRARNDEGISAIESFANANRIRRTIMKSDEVSIFEQILKELEEDTLDVKSAVCDE